ncbi:MAG: cation transporter [bacterium]
MMTHAHAESHTVGLAISGMSCGHCVARVRKALDGIHGIDHADVTVGNATLTLGAGDRATVLDEVTRALAASGYPARVTPGSEATP